MIQITFFSRTNFLVHLRWVLFITNYEANGTLMELIPRIINVDNVEIRMALVGLIK